MDTGPTPLDIVRMHLRNGNVDAALDEIDRLRTCNEKRLRDLLNLVIRHSRLPRHSESSGGSDTRFDPRRAAYNFFWGANGGG